MIDAGAFQPTGTRVLVQGNHTRPELDGQRGWVLGFQPRSVRYTVALDDDETTWSLLAECVTRAGCAALGCESEEAGSVCSRCQAVRYCSSECQRLDLRAHKSACEEAVAAAAAS